jgi:dTDP-glucose pyrophosphorylase
MTNKPLVLIPAAGFGTRVGSPPAKELFKSPNGSPLIAFGLDQARRRGWPVHVITRKEKTELIQYLQAYREKWSLELEIQLIEPSREWPDTLLKSEPYWREKNLLCLPDTIFEPIEIWDRLVATETDMAAATFKVDDFSKWGVFRFHENCNEISICEKPRQDSTVSSDTAWGILCWNEASGRKLLSAQLESSQDHAWKKLGLSLQCFELQRFEDVTRG